MSMDCATESRIVATGHSDGAVRLWDPRGTGTTALMVESVVRLSLRSHTNWVTGLKWSVGSSMHLCTGSYDGSVKVWDIRSTTPLYSLGSGDEKVFGVDWRNGILASGGEDCNLHIYASPRL